jgi:hypothetical protein
MTLEEYLDGLELQTLTDELKEDILDYHNDDLADKKTDLDDVNYEVIIEHIIYRHDNKLYLYQTELLELVAESYKDLASKQKFEFLITKIESFTLEQLKEKLS